MLDTKPVSSKREEQARRKDSKKKMKVVILSIITVLVLGGIMWVFAQSNTGDSTPGSRIISRYGIHWHPHLLISIKGKQITIPANIGLTGTTESPIHTHDSDGIIHMEFSGRVTEKDTELKNFFEVWGKDFSQDSLLGNKTGKDGKVHMYVNGKENFEFGGYFMKDNDTIELKFE